MPERHLSVCQRRFPPKSQKSSLNQVGYNCGVPRWFGILLFFHAILIALMPPGLCSCWINPGRETVHVHFGYAHAASEHSHEYLNQLGLANAGGFLPLLLIPAALLLQLLSATDIFWRISRFACLHREWKPSVTPPPPRGTIILSAELSKSLILPLPQRINF